MYCNTPLHNGFSPAQLSKGRMLKNRVPCHLDNSCQKCKTSPPWRRDRRTTDRRRRRTMTEDIKSLLKRKCHRMTGYGYLTRGKKERSSRIMRPKDLSSSRSLIAVCLEETNRWPGSCTSQQFLLIQWRTLLQACCQQMHLPTLMQTGLQTKACLPQQLCLPFQCHNVQWKLPSLCRPNNNLHSEDPVGLKRRLGIWLKNSGQFSELEGTMSVTQADKTLCLLNVNRSTWVDRRHSRTEPTVRK